MMDDALGGFCIEAGSLVGEGYRYDEIISTFFTTPIACASFQHPLSTIPPSFISVLTRSQHYIVGKRTQPEHSSIGRTSLSS